MGELRFILLAAGALLIGGLWWWELRRSSRTQRLRADLPASARQEPMIEALPEVESVTDDPDAPLPTLRAAPEDRPVPGTSPPLVTIENLPEDTDQIVLASRDEPHSPLRTSPGLGPIARPTALVEEMPVSPPSRAGSEVAVAPRPPPRRAPSGSDSEPGAKQKITAIRLVATSPERIGGGELRAALEGEGLQYGRYSIYHRQRPDGRMLYSVASLREPGSFELERMAAQRYPGVSIFAVFPGPTPAPELFDEMLALARRLGERLGCVLQDERDSSLTAQRVVSLREDLVQFEHTVATVRTRSTA